MFGEDTGDSFYRCPGDNECELWDAMAGDYQQKQSVCIDCTRCKGKPPILTDSNSPEAVTKRMVQRTESLIGMIDSGQPFDWNLIDYIDWLLISVWRAAEIDCERRHHRYIRAVVDSMRQ